jgi:hypothetical protein
MDGCDVWWSATILHSTWINQKSMASLVGPFLFMPKLLFHYHKVPFLIWIQLAILRNIVLPNGKNMQ